MITITNDSYHAGRIAPIRVIVAHTAECPCEPGRAVNVATFLKRPDVNASAHYIVDPDATVAQIDEADTAWAAPGANADGIQIEQCAYAAFNADQWTSGPGERMLRTQTVPLIADICRRHGLPAVWLTAADLLAGKRGITDHVTVNQAYARSDHADCGHDFPGQMVASMVNDLLRGTPAHPTPSTEDDDMPKAYLSVGGVPVLVAGVTYRAYAARPWPDVLAGFLALEAEGRLEKMPRNKEGNVALPTISDSALALYREV